MLSISKPYSLIPKFSCNLIVFIFNIDILTQPALSQGEGDRAGGNEVLIRIIKHYILPATILIKQSKNH